jgi:voltage-gated sodium channel
LIAFPQPASLTPTALVRGIVVTSFTVLNLLIALIVNSMQSLQAETNQTLRAEAVVAHDEREVLLDRIELLAREVRQLRESVRRD